MKIAIIGGGASGLSCAVEASERAREKGIFAEITVYEAKDRVGKKILATGNGRCNMMNMNSCRYFGDSSFAESVLEMLRAILPFLKKWVCLQGLMKREEFILSAIRHQACLMYFVSNVNASV